MDNNVFIHLKLSANLHQRDTEPEPTNYRTQQFKAAKLVCEQ